LNHLQRHSEIPRSPSNPIKCGVRKEANKWIGQKME
jgi:hypothetical protein